MKKLLLIILPLMVSADQFYKTSYDCTKTQENSVEWKVCKDVKLAALDQTLSNKYTSIKRLGGLTQEIKQEQRSWLKEKNRCTTTSCISDTYQSRVSELAKVLDALPWDLSFNYKIGRDRWLPFHFYFYNDYEYVIEQTKVIKKYKEYEEKASSFIGKTTDWKQQKKNAKEIEYQTIFPASNFNIRSHKQVQWSSARCPMLMGNLRVFEKVSKEGEVLNRKYLFFVTNKPEEIKGGYCETDDFNGKYVETIKLIYPLFYYVDNNEVFLKIKDEYVVRFDENFESKSKLFGTKLFWMDENEYKALAKKYKVRTIKDEEMMLRQWIKEQQKGNR